MEGKILWSDQSAKNQSYKGEGEKSCSSLTSRRVNTCLHGLKHSIGQVWNRDSEYHV